MLVAFAVICSFLASFLLHRLHRRKRLPLPPGPRGKPIIGNALDIPSENSWFYYTELYKEFGDVVYLSAFGQPMILLNTMDTVNDVLVERASTSSDRPPYTMLGEMMHFGGNLVLRRYGPRWRSDRRLLRQYIRKPALRQYHAQMIREACSYVGRIHDKPDEYSEELHLSVVRNVVGVAYGFHVESHDDPYSKHADAVMGAIVDAFLPGNFLVDMLPSLKFAPSWFPGAGFKRHAQKWAPAVDKMVSMPYERVKKEMASHAEGTAVPSLTSQLLEMDDNNTNSMTSYDKMWLSGTLYGTGLETTSIIVVRFLFTMSLYPEIQRKAQEEVDKVIGTDQLPTFDDQDRLPYVDALIKELYRWHVMSPTAVPHRLMEDEEYRGFLLPKGSWIVPNTWAISRDSSTYPDPDRFNPDRFIVPDGQPVPLDPRQIVFGFGRRKCPGADFAETVLWSNIVIILATTTILKGLGPDGKEITPPIEFSGGIVTRPTPFSCRFKVRSEERMSLAKLGAA